MPPPPNAPGKLRRAMPRVALAAAALYLLRQLVETVPALSGSRAGGLVKTLASLAIFVAAVYYGWKGLGWLLRGVGRWVGWTRDRLLWRVRRRLVITYLFVGLTPILLLALLGMLAGFGVSAEAMARIIGVEVDSLVRQAADSASVLARDLARRQGRAAEGELRGWIAERAALLRASLPAVRIEVRRDDSRLPAWLRGKEEWSGLASEEAAGASGEERISLSVKALARGGPFVVLVEVPVGPELADNLSRTTRIQVRPAGEPLLAETPASDTTPAEGVDAGDLVRGGSLQALPYLVVMHATDWKNGESAQRIAFVFDWSWATAIEQVLGGFSGRWWQYGLIAVAAVFLGLELVALLLAAWMTRAVTGAVHALHLATGFVRRGDFSHRVEIRSRDQLGELAGAFNDMSAHVESLLEERVKRERLERELEIAAEVQARLFPRSVPALAGAEIAGECRAARGVAGDYFDFVELGPEIVALVLGDVSGKGISAALLMASLQASLRAEARMVAETWSLGQAPALAVGGEGSRAAAARTAERAREGAVARLVESLNDSLGRSTDSNRFATLFVALYDNRLRSLRYTNAGHSPAILVHADGSVERLARGGTMVGAFEGARYEEARVGLRPGSLLVVFSDGLSEAQDASGSEYGEERLVRFAVEHRRLPAAAMLRALFAEVGTWTESDERADDQSVVILKVRDEA